MVSIELRRIFGQMTRQEILETKIYLDQRYRNTKSADMERYREYLGMVEDIWKKKLKRDRMTDYVWMRAFIAYAMRQGGATLWSIGECLGVNHSSVSHYFDKIEAMEDYPTMYGDITGKWELFKKRIYDIQ